ncbi:uncharacterized protein LOC144291784 isoform X2 [Canis aureus]
MKSNVVDLNEKWCSTTIHQTINQWLSLMSKIFSIDKFILYSCQIQLGPKYLSLLTADVCEPTTNSPDRRHCPGLEVWGWENMQSFDTITFSEFAKTFLVKGRKLKEQSGDRGQGDERLGLRGLIACTEERREVTILHYVGGS